MFCLLYVFSWLHACLLYAFSWAHFVASHGVMLVELMQISAGSAGRHFGQGSIDPAMISDESAG